MLYSNRNTFFLYKIFQFIKKIIGPDPVQSQSSSIETQNQESSRRILLASLIIVVIVVISLVWVLCFCKNKKHGHIPGALIPTQNMPFSPSDRHTGEKNINNVVLISTHFFSSRYHLVPICINFFLAGTR